MISLLLTRVNDDETGSEKNNHLCQEEKDYIYIYSPIFENLKGIKIQIKYIYFLINNFRSTTTSRAFIRLQLDASEPPREACSNVKLRTIDLWGWQ